MTTLSEVGRRLSAAEATLRGIAGRASTYATDAGVSAAIAARTPISVVDFGASTSADDNAPAINAALAAAGSTQRVFVPSGTWRITSPLIGSAAQVLHGEINSTAGSGTVIKATAAMDRMVYSTTNIEIQNVLLDCDGYASRGVQIVGASGLSKLSNVRVLNPAGNAFDFDQCQLVFWDRLFAAGAIGGHGFRLHQCNGAVLIMCSAHRYQQTVRGGTATEGRTLVKGVYGFHITGNPQSGAVRLHECNAEGTLERAFNVRDTLRATVLDNCWSECGGADAMERPDHFVLEGAVRPIIRGGTISAGVDGMVARTLHAQYAGGVASETIDASTSRIAWLLPSDADAHWISHLMIELSANSSLVGDFAIETDTAGLPSGTNAHANLVRSGHAFTSTDPERIELATYAADATKGQKLAAGSDRWLVFYRTSGTGRFEGVADTDGTVKVWNGSAWVDSAITDLRAVVGNLSQSYRIRDCKAPIIEDCAALDSTVAGSGDIAIEDTNGTTVLHRVQSNALETTATPVPLEVFAERCDGRGSVARRVTSEGSAAPSAGTWQVGDFVRNIAPAVNGIVGWFCTASGTPGTWVPLLLGSVQADTQINLTLSGGEAFRIQAPSGVREIYSPNTFMAIRALTTGRLCAGATGGIKMQWNANGVAFNGATPPATVPSITGATTQDQVDSIVAAGVALGVWTDDR